MRKIKILAICAMLLLSPSVVHGGSFTDILKKSTDEIKVVLEEEMGKIAAAQQKNAKEVERRMRDHVEAGEDSERIVATLNADFEKKNKPK